MSLKFTLVFVVLCVHLVAGEPGDDCATGRLSHESWPAGTVNEVNETYLGSIVSHGEENNCTGAMLVMSYAKWCSFSTQLKPIFAALAQSFPTLPHATIDGSLYDKFRNIDAPCSTSTRRVGGDMISLEKIASEIASLTGLKPVPGVTVQPGPPIKLNPEREIYLWLASAWVALCVGYGVWWLWSKCSIRLFQHEKED